MIESAATPASPPASATRWFARTLAITALVKLLLAVFVPFTTDEAYFVLWGRNLDYGYYDHGAMTGWWLGYAIAPAAESQAIRKVHDFLTVGAPAPLQAA